MAKANERIPRWTNPLLGELIWDERDQAWAGRVEFAGRVVPLSVDTGRRDPDHEERLAAVGPAPAFLQRLAAAEPAMRRQAAEEVAAAVGEQQDEVVLPADEFAATLELDEVSVCAGAALHYRSPAFFPSQVVTVYVNTGLSFGGAGVYRPRAGAKPVSGPRMQ